MNIRQSLPRTPSIASWNMSLGTKEAWGQGGQWAVRPFVCWIITIQISMTSFTHACPLYALAISDGPNSRVGRVGRPFCRVHTPPGSCVGSGHSEGQGESLYGRSSDKQPSRQAGSFDQSVYHLPVFYVEDWQTELRSSKNISSVHT